MIKSRVGVSIYLIGEDLEISEITKILEIDPSKIFIKGTEKMPGRKDSTINLKNIWVYSLKYDLRSVDESLRDLLEKLPLKTGGLMQMPGVQDAYADVFLANTVPDGDLGNSIEFEMGQDVVKLLCKLGLPIHFSVCNVSEGS